MRVGTLRGGYGFRTRLSDQALGPAADVLGVWIDASNVAIRTTEKDVGVQEIEVQPASLEQLGEVLLPGHADALRFTASRARSLLAGRVVWNINATAHGGGVAEMLQGLLAYGRGAGVDTRWLVLDGDPEFFAITKRSHNALHGSGDGNRTGCRGS